MRYEVLTLNEQRRVTMTNYLLDTPADFGPLKKRPAVLIMPGGAYCRCSNREGEPVAMAFLAQGYSVSVLRYSLMEHAAFPNPLDDAQQAIALMRERAEEWGIDGEKIVAVGFSAGGHLAAALGTMGEIRPNAVVLGYPPTKDGVLTGGLPIVIPDVSEQVDERTPPTFLFATLEDKAVPMDHALRLITALNKQGIKFEAHLFEHGKHGLNLATKHNAAGDASNIEPAEAQWFGLCIEWLDRLLDPFALVDGLKVLTAQQAGEYSVDVLISSFWGDARARAVVLDYLPRLSEAIYARFCQTFTLRKYREYYPVRLSDEQLEGLDQALRALPLNA